MGSSSTHEHSFIQCALKRVKFIEKYAWLYDYPATDLFTSNIFEERCPPHWQSLLHGSISSSEMDFIKLWVQVASKDVDAMTQIKMHWPSDLLDFIEEAHSMSLSTDFLSFPLSSSSPMDPMLTLGMTPKKAYEVPCLASFIKKWCGLYNVKHLVDLGAGQGYLSSVLAYQHDFHVIGVDNDPVQIQGAQKRLKRIQKSKLPTQGSIHFVQKHVTPKDTFQTLLNEQPHSFLSFPTSSLPLTLHETKPWGFIGLHTCGDLSSTTLRLWQASQAQLVINIGCCYNLLTELTDHDSQEKHGSQWTSHSDPLSDSVYGFPMSEKLSHVQLGRTARLLACQSTSRWIHHFQNAYDSFVRHFYRALLQTYLQDFPSHPPIKTFQTRKGKVPTFPSYATAAFHQLDLPVPLDLEERYEKYMQQGGLRKVTMMWTLRAHMAEAIESLILLDRCLWLQQQDPKPQVCLFPLFDPLQSPRNFVIACVKPTPQDG
ncbi:hypothetical protein HMI54_007400 [Coelomomyces lativittatus]|nr:hypothetical protein HMI55_006351 [Coelomomyces lativittatus]KAJ1514878.1 hypothetical protein HMI56_007193 [Coelomomyces lativittatus]KAJ1517009.1 hypothetical protein HMI54_007400 [Coelomomyces lativittatus]